MVRIDSTGSAGRARSVERVRGSSKKSRASGSGGASFARSLSEVSGGGGGEVEALGAEGSLEGVVGDVGLLALQERGDERGGGARGRAIAYGEGLIERLRALHVRLLSGDVSGEELLRLESYFVDGEGGGGGLGSIEDEGLRSLLGEIELRVQVELAKRRR